LVQLKTKQRFDLEIAEAFVEKHSRDLLRVHMPRRGRPPEWVWFVLSGGVWRREVTLQVLDLIRQECKAHGVEHGMDDMVSAVHRLVSVHPLLQAAKLSASP